AHSVKKILKAKYWSGLQEYKPVEIDSLEEDLNAHENDVLYEELMENAITLIKNNKAILPIKKLVDEKIAYVPFGDASGEDFFKMLNKYTRVDKVEAKSLDILMERLETYDKVIIGFHKPDESPWSAYQFTQEELVWLHEISVKHQTIL